MSNDRSERLRKRRQRRDEPDETDGTGEQSEASDAYKTSETTKPPESSEGRETDEQSEASEQSETDKGDEDDSESLQDERVGTYMYLPESQHEDLKNTYNLLKAKYEAEYDHDFEKNRHFFPLVITYGLDSLEDADASDVRERLDGQDLL